MFFSTARTKTFGKFSQTMVLSCDESAHEYQLYSCSVGEKGVNIVKDLLKKNPKRNDDFVQLYSNVNVFLIGQIDEERWRRIEAPQRQQLSPKTC